MNEESAGPRVFTPTFCPDQLWGPPSLLSSLLLTAAVLKSSTFWDIMLLSHFQLPVLKGRQNGVGRRQPAEQVACGIRKRLEFGNQPISSHWFFQKTGTLIGNSQEETRYAL
jgi:hypothetical protein